MPIPKYDEMYRAYLQCLADGRPHYFTEVKEKVAAAMNVTREEQRQMMTNRPVSLFDNRIGWTRTYLKKAGLILTVSHHAQIGPLYPDVLKTLVYGACRELF